MLRIIDMREACSGDSDFSVWDTVRDRFLEDRDGDQSWMGEEDFRQAGFDVETTERACRLLPGWARSAGEANREQT